VLPDLLQVCQGILLPLHDSGHSTESSPLELLTSVERITEFEQSDVILGDLRNEVAGGVELTESKLVMILVVQDIEEIAQERVEVLKVSSDLTRATRAERLTSRMGNSETIRPIFSSKVS